MRIKRKVEDSGDGNIFWITMTDLMTGLVLVFIVMFFYAFLQNNINKFNEDLAKENASKALFMVAGVLIGLLILTLMVTLLASSKDLSKLNKLLREISSILFTI